MAAVDKLWHSRPRQEEAVFRWRVHQVITQRLPVVVGEISKQPSGTEQSQLVKCLTVYSLVNVHLWMTIKLFLACLYNTSSPCFKLIPSNYVSLQAAKKLHRRSSACKAIIFLAVMLGRVNCTVQARFGQTVINMNCLRRRRGCVG